MMSFLPTTYLGLVDMMSVTTINIEYMRMKEFTASTAVPTPRNGTPSGTKTRSKASLASKRELIKSVLINSSSDKIQRMDSAQEERLTLMKSLIATQAQTNHIVLKDTATNTDSSTLHTSIAICTVQADFVDAGSCTDELNENSEAATFQQANSSTAFTIPPVSSDSPFFVHKKKHSTKVYDAKTELNLRAGNTVHFTSDVDQSHVIRNAKPYPDSSKTLRELQESLIRVNEDFKLDSYICRVNMINNQGSCNFNPVDFIAENTTCYFMVLGGTCTIESVNTIGPVFPQSQHLKGGDIISMSSNSINRRLFFGVWGEFGEFDLFLGLGIDIGGFVFCFEVFFELFLVLKSALKPSFYIVALSFQSTSSAPVIIIKFFKTSVSAQIPKPKPLPLECLVPSPTLSRTCY